MGIPGRPDKEKALANEKRDKNILSMKEKGYPLGYIAQFHGISKSRVIHIVKRKDVEKKLAGSNELNRDKVK